MSASTITFSAFCPCGCGEHVTATDAGFAATTVEVGACAASALVSVTMRKTDAYARAVPVSAGVRHADGLVVMVG